MPKAKEKGSRSNIDQEEKTLDCKQNHKHKKMLVLLAIVRNAFRKQRHLVSESYEEVYTSILFSNVSKLNMLYRSMTLGYTRVRTVLWLYASKCERQMKWLVGSGLRRGLKMLRGADRHQITQHNREQLTVCIYMCICI